MNNGVRLEAVDLRRVTLPLVAPFRTSFGTETVRDILLVQVKGPDTSGWGECVAMAEPGYSSEYVDGAHDVIRRHLLPRLMGAAAGAVAVEDVGPALAGVRGHPMAKAAVEMALLDARLRRDGVGMASWLGGVRDAVPAGVSVGIQPSVPALLDVVAAYLDDGYVRVKLKVEPGWDVDVVAAVRSRFGDDLVLQVDANSAYSVEDGDHLAQLDAFGLLLIEQPLAEDDLAGHAALARRLGTPICLDESITSLVACRSALDLGACSIVNVKAGRVGGYLEARRIHDLCLSRNVPVWCGGMLETGLGRAANVALATLPNFTLPNDLSASDRYWANDLTAPFVLHGGCLLVPEGPGLGVAPEPDVLESATTSVETIRWE